MRTTSGTLVHVPDPRRPAVGLLGRPGQPGRPAARRRPGRWSCCRWPPASWRPSARTSRWSTRCSSTWWRWSPSPCVGGLLPAVAVGGRRQPAAQLVLHPAAAHLDGRRAAEPAGARAVRHRRGRRQRHRPPGRPAVRARPRAARTRPACCSPWPAPCSAATTPQPAFCARLAADPRRPGRAGRARRRRLGRAVASRREPAGEPTHLRGTAEPAAAARAVTRHAPAPGSIDGFAAQAAAALDRERLRRQAAEAEALAEGNRIRTALLAAVGHDLRTPLASVKAGGQQPAADRLTLSDERPAGLAGDHRGGRRPARRAHRQPARPEPAADRVAAPELRATVARRGGTAGVARARRPGAGSSCPRTCRWSAPTPACSSGCSPTCSPTRVRYSPAGRPPDAAPPGPTAAGSPSRSSTTGRASPTRPKTRVFEPSSGSTTGPAAASASASRWPRASSRRWAARIRAFDTDGGGLTMQVRLPLAASMTSPADSSDAILVVDDEPPILRALSITLTARDYTVVTAADGADGLRSGRRRPTRRRHPRPRPARHGRRRGHPRHPRLVGDRRSSCCRRASRSSRRSPRSTRAPTTT